MINYFIPKEYFENDELLRQARLFVIICFITPMFSSYYLVVSTLYDMKVTFWSMLFNATVFPILPFLFKRNIIKLGFLTNIFIFVGSVGAFSCAFVNGGLVSSILPWLSLLPVLSVLLSNKKNGIFWLIANLLAIIIVGILDYSGFGFINEMKEHFRHYFIVGNLAGLSLILFLIVNVFENTKNEALLNLDRKNNQLDEERKNADKLLLNILPNDVVNELKEKGRSTAKHYQSVTVVFADFVDFTSLSEELSPEELVGELDSYFREFDHIIELHGLEKIKTIGDAYLAVSGLPKQNSDHAIHAISAAKDLLNFVKRKMSDGGRFDVRIGIHSGPLVAGRVGVRKFAFDIWGDTVNTASRMQSASDPGKINVGHTTYELTNNFFKFDQRGKIAVKGKGEIEMYFLKTI